jgi:hypothetical protein
MMEYRVIRNYPSAEFFAVLEDALNTYAAEGWQMKGAFVVAGDIAVIMEREKPLQPIPVVFGQPDSGKRGRKAAQ